jgi:hypothetical protein
MHPLFPFLKLIAELDWGEQLRSLLFDFYYRLVNGRLAECLGYCKQRMVSRSMKRDHHGIYGMVCFPLEQPMKGANSVP